MNVNGVEYLHGRDSLNGPVEPVAYDAGWPEIFCDLRDNIRSALGSTSITVEHIGSTTQKPRVQQSVPSWLNTARAPNCRWLSLVFPLWNMWW